MVQGKKLLELVFVFNKDITTNLIPLLIYFAILLIIQEDRNNRTHDSTSSTVDKRGEGDGEPALPMSPILKRVIDHNRRNNQDKYHQKSYVDLPHATLDLSGGDMFSPKNKANSSQAIDKQHTSLERAALELSTLV